MPRPICKAVYDKSMERELVRQMILKASFGFVLPQEYFATYLFIGFEEKLDLPGLDQVGLLSRI